MSFAGGEITALIIMGILLMICALAAWVFKDAPQDLGITAVCAVVIVVLFLSCSMISAHDRNLEQKAEKSLSAQGFQVLNVEYNFWTDATVKVIGKNNCIAKYYIERDIRGWHVVDDKKLITPTTINCNTSTS